MSQTIAVFIGSSSQTSYSRLVVRYLQKIAPATLKLQIVEIGDLPLYDRDLDANPPAAYERVRAAVQSAAGVLWVSPEHNGAMTAMLKNVIDVVTRPTGQSQWLGKPLGIITLGAGMSGGACVADQLRAIAARGSLSMPTYPQNVCISSITHGVFDASGEVISVPVKTLLHNFIDGYAGFVARFQ